MTWKKTASKFNKTVWNGKKPRSVKHLGYVPVQIWSTILFGS